MFVARRLAGGRGGGRSLCCTRPKQTATRPTKSWRLRGYLQFLLGDEKLDEDDKLAKLQEIMPLLQRREEKITAIAVLQGIPASAALDRLAAFASDQRAGRRRVFGACSGCVPKQIVDSSV